MAYYKSFTMSNASSVGYNTLSIISSILGVFTAIPLIISFVQSQHPETRMRELDSMLKETETLLRSVVEEGLLDPQCDAPHFEYQLTLYALSSACSFVYMFITLGKAPFSGGIIP